MWPPKSKFQTGKSKGIRTKNLDAFVFIYRSKTECLSGTEQKNVGYVFLKTKSIALFLFHRKYSFI